MRKFKIFVAAVLLFAVAFGIFASAAPASLQGSGLDGYVAKNGSLTAKTEGVSFSIEKENASVYCPIGNKDIFPGANRLSFVLSNSSACGELRVKVCYEDGDEKLFELEIEKYSSRNTYILNVGSCAGIVGVELGLGAQKSGTLNILSICAVSFFEENIEAIGEVSSCTYSSKTVTLKGSLQYSSDKKYHDSTISVYALSGGDSVEDILSGKLEPIHEGGAMSIRFELSVPIDSVEDRLKRYAVAVVSEDGPVLVDMPIYPSVEVPDAEHGFKGIETSQAAGAVSVMAELSIIDVEIASLMSSGHNGYMFTADSTRYFFDMNYLNSLDAKVKTVSGAKSEVYLRLSDLESFYANYGLLGVYAVARFLCDRYSSFEYGRISGIVLGESTNEKIPADSSLAEYSKRSYDLLYTVFAAANDAKHPINAVFSLSDRWGIRPQSTAVSTDLFAAALFSVCGYYSENRFGIITEMTQNPYSIDNKYVESLGKSEDDEAAEEEAAVAELIKSDPENGYVTAENIKLFLGELKKLSKEYMEADVDIICAWSPAENTSDSALTASYIYGYYSTFFSGYADAFVIRMPKSEEAELSAIGDIRYVMKKIDTKGAGVSELVKEMFGISDLSEEINGFDLAALENRVLRESLSVVPEIPKEVIGKYDYWNFETQSVGGWYAGAGCSSLSIENTKTEGRSLTARFSPPDKLSGEYSFFAYEYEKGESLKYNDYLLIDLLISADSGRNFEINVMIGGEGYQYEYRTSELLAGKRYTVSLALDELTAERPIEYIRICAKELTASADIYSLSVYSISAASEKYSDSQLEKLIEKERETIREDESQSEDPKVFWIIIIVIVVIATVVVMLMLGRSKKNTRPEDRV